MLERFSLLLESLRPGPNGPCRIIRDAQTLEILGHAFRSQALGILGWCLPLAWTVYEVPDSSLLCTVRKPWSLSGERTILDADNTVVGKLIHRRIIGHEGSLIATRDRNEFHTPGGRELAAWQNESSATLLEFRPVLEADPLAKMMLLAAVLDV